MSHAEPPEMVLLMTAANAFEAHLLSQALNEEGIHSKVLGDFLDAGIGNIPGVGAEIWVVATETARAQEIIEEHQRRQLKAGQERGEA